MGEGVRESGGLPSFAKRGHLGFLIRIPGFLRKVMRLSQGTFCSGVSNGQGRAHPLGAGNEDIRDDRKAYCSASWGCPRRQADSPVFPAQ